MHLGKDSGPGPGRGSDAGPGERRGSRGVNQRRGKRGPEENMRDTLTFLHQP